ncbi:MAG: hypothetical protein H8E91_01610 [Planctomycetes bacterium]|nr:hypothetical protein [Planctomycetota bacterium]
MNYRLIAIRVLYYSLGFAALTGVTAVFVPTNSPFLGRLLGTAIATGISAGFMLLAVRGLENPKTRPLGTTIGIIICIVLPLIYFTIWLDAITSIRNSVIEHLALTAVIVFFCGIPLSLGAALITHKQLKRAGYFLLPCWSCLILLWTFDVWRGGIGTYNYIEAIAIPLAWCSPVAALLLLRWPKSVVPLILLTVSCVLWQWYGATVDHWNEYATPLAVIFILGWVPCSLAFWNLLTLRKQQYAIRKSELAATTIASLAIAFCFAYAWTNITGNESDILLRFAIACSILGGTSVLAVFITQVLRMSMYVAKSSSSLHAICPRCENKINLPQGKSRCPACNLQFKVLFESPNCSACAYDLTGTDKKLCPECGVPICATALQ